MVKPIKLEGEILIKMPDGQIKTPKMGDRDLFYTCGKCGKLYLTKYAAEQDCTCNYICKSCGFDGNKTKIKTSLIGRSLCSSCYTEKKLREAEVVEYTGQPICDDYGNYYLDSDSLDNYLSDLSLEDLRLMDTRFFCCREDKWKGICLESVLENEMEDRHEDAIDDVKDYTELEAYLKEWNAKQNIVTYYEDYKKIVDVREHVDDYIKDLEDVLNA